MSVSPEEVHRIAALARIRLEPEDEARLARELSGILAHVEALQGVELAPSVEGRNAVPTPPRPSEMGPDPLAEDALAEMAPDWRDGFFALPRLSVLDGEDE